jgi:hypothetical protein
MPQDRKYLPARMQSPAGADRQGSLGERLRKAAASPTAKSPTAPPKKSSVLGKLKDRWAPVRKYSSRR